MKIALLAFLFVSLAFSQQCQKGGLLYAQGSCQYPSYIEGCLTYSADNTCAQCQYSYQLNSGFCIYNPQSFGVDCCLTFDNSSKCIQCSKGLLLNPTTNLCQDIKIFGCVQKNQNGCAVCSSAFDLVGTKCIKSLQGCTTYDSFHNCILCNSSFSLIQGVCVQLIQTPVIPNCRITNQFGCVECNKAFYKAVDGSCLPSAGGVGCVRYAKDGSCLKCQDPYYQLTNGSCLINGCLKYSGSDCLNCDSSYGFTLVNNRCEIPNCIYFGARGCSTCKSGLVSGSWGCKTPLQNVCIICKIGEYLGSDGKCYEKDLHCLQYMAGICQGCYDSYFLINNTCRVKQNGCIYTNGICTSCKSPFTFVNGQCLISGCTQYTALGCQTCDSRLILNNNVCGLPFCSTISNYICTQCISGYQLNSNHQCILVDVNCKIKNTLNICLKCNDGYQLGSDGTCISMKLGCNYVDGVCTSCRAPFTYISSTKSCIIDGCLQYFIGGCQTCDDSYTLLYNSCKLPNCLVSQNKQCLQCDPDYVFTSDGRCVNKDQFCDKMDQFGTCIKCMSSYYYSVTYNKCIKKSPGCTYTDNKTCCSCFQPFVYSQGLCTIPGCLTLFEAGCSECNYPFQLTKNNICEIKNCNAYSNGTCIGCVEGYVLNNKNVCSIQDPNCLCYNIQQTQCQKCIKGYRIDQNGRCQYADENCWSFDQSGICMNCDRLYFLNSYGKCQLRDPQCTTYVCGFCSECLPYYFPSQGICMANILGCKVQQSYSLCLTCDEGYTIRNGVCEAQITQLSWNSIDMDFSDNDNNNSVSVFTVGVDSKLNLLPCIFSGKANVFYSSSSLNNVFFQVNTQGNIGWSPSNEDSNGFVGVQSNSFLTFYALDIKQLTGSTLQTFTLEYSADNIIYNSIGSFSLVGCIIGSIKTFYFKPVQAKYIRLIVGQGAPNIKFEFYISNTNYTAPQNNNDTSFISTTLSTVIAGINGGVSTCDGKGLCWAGVQACSPRQLKGFNLIYTNCTALDVVNEVTIDYSMDGITFTCWNNCQSTILTSNSYTFENPLLAEKVHIHFSKYSGQPKFGISFIWA